MVPTVACPFSKSNATLGWAVEKLCSLDNLMGDDAGNNDST